MIVYTSLYKEIPLRAVCVVVAIMSTSRSLTHTGTRLVGIFLSSAHNVLSYYFTYNTKDRMSKHAIVESTPYSFSFFQAFLHLCFDTPTNHAHTHTTTSAFIHYFINYIKKSLLSQHNQVSCALITTTTTTAAKLSNAMQCIRTVKCLKKSLFFHPSVLVFFFTNT